MWHRTETDGRHDQTNTMGNIPELAVALSTTCGGEHVHATGSAGSDLTATERYPPDLQAPTLKAIRCHAGRSEGISLDATVMETASHVDKNRCRCQLGNLGNDER